MKLRCRAFQRAIYEYYPVPSNTIASCAKLVVSYDEAITLHGLWLLPFQKRIFGSCFLFSFRKQKPLQNENLSFFGFGPTMAGNIPRKNIQSHTRDLFQSAWPSLDKTLPFLAWFCL